MTTYSFTYDSKAQTLVITKEDTISGQTIDVAFVQGDEANELADELDTAEVDEQQAILSLYDYDR